MQFYIGGQRICHELNLGDPLARFDAVCTYSHRTAIKPRRNLRLGTSIFGGVLLTYRVIVWDFNCGGIFRAFIDDAGNEVFGCFREDGENLEDRSKVFKS
jgi:hypothetical protein